MQSSLYSPSSQPSLDSPASYRGTDHFSAILNIDQTVAKSRQIIQESLEVSRKNNERRQLLEERLKGIVCQSEFSRADIIPRGYEESEQERPQESSKIQDWKHRLEEEAAAKEVQVAELRQKLLQYEHLEAEFEKMKDDLQDSREELRREQAKSRDLAEFASANHKKLKENVEDLESTIRRLKLDLDRCKEDNLQLERAIRTADEQRAELLKECELLRQTLADLKKLHLRELEETGKRLDEAIRDKNAAERNILEERKVTIRREDDNLQSQIRQLEAKLRDVEQKYSHQMALNQNLQSEVQSLQARTKVPAFEAQVQENARRIDELQQRLEQSKVSRYASDTESELSSEDLTALVRREQAELGLNSVLRPKNTSKRANSKGKALQRVYASAPRRKVPKTSEKRTLSRCKYCHE